MDRLRGWLGVWVAMALLAGDAAAGFLIGKDTDPAPRASAVPPPTQTVERTVTERTVTTTPEEKQPPRRSGPPGWRGEGYRQIQIRRGAELPVLASPGGNAVKRFDHKTEFGSPRVLWVAERRGPWLGVVAPELGNGNVGWLRLDRDSLRFGRTPYSMHVDLSDRLIQLRRGDTLVRRVVVSVGRIGSGTPPGRFAVTDIVTDGISEAYGCCAIALSAVQPNTPAGWIGGNRIAVHGWNGPVGDAASGGCLRASNDDVRSLIKRVPLGSPVFIDS
jgi:hypothetical protein